MAVTGRVTLGSGQMSSGADDARQIVAAVETAGVGRRAAIAQQTARRPRVRFRPGRSPRRVRYGAVRTQPDVAVRVDQPGQNPAAVENRVGISDRFAADPAVDDPQLDGFFVGQPDSSNVLTALLIAREFQLGQVEIGQPGRQFVKTLRHIRQVGKPGRHARAERAADLRLASARTSCPSSLCHLCAFAFLRVADLRPSPGMPMPPTIEDIILRASKKRSTS